MSQGKYKNRINELSDLVKATFENSVNTSLRRFASSAYYLTVGLIVTASVGYSAIYILFAGEMVREVAEFYLGHVIHSQPLYIYQLILALVLVPFCCLTTMHSMSYLSIAGNTFTACGLLVAMQYCFRNFQPLENLDAVRPFDLNNTFIFLSFGFFISFGPLIVIPIRISMKNPVSFGGWNGLLTLAGTIMIVLNTSVGFFGYMALGRNAQLLLSELPEHWIYHLLKLGWIFPVFINYNFQVFLFMEIVRPFIRKKIKSKSKGERLLNYLLRLVWIAATTLLAIFVPCLKQFIALVGSISLAVLILALPPILDTIIQCNSKITTKVALTRLLPNAFIISIGLFSTFYGTWINLIELSEALANIQPGLAYHV